MPTSATTSPDGNDAGPWWGGSSVVRRGDIVYVAGVSALSHLPGPLAERPLPADFAAQARLTFANLAAALATAGASLDAVFRLTMQLGDRERFDEIGRIRSLYLPSRAYVSTRFIARFARPDLLIDVAAEAYCPR